MSVSVNGGIASACPLSTHPLARPGALSAQQRDALFKINWGSNWSLCRLYCLIEFQAVGEIANDLDMGLPICLKSRGRPPHTASFRVRKSRTCRLIFEIHL